MIRSRLAATVAILLVAAACGSTSAETTTTMAVATTTIATSTTTSPATTTAPTTTAPATTTTTVPRLDRTPAVAMARMQSDLEQLLVNGPRVSGSDAEAAAAGYFAAVVEGITGTAPRIEEFPLPTGATSVNVWSAAVGEGDLLLVLGAHLDSVSGAPGANDNGSGSVILLELLRRLVEDPPEGLRIVVVGFGAEERIGEFGHHFGSRHAVAELEPAGGLPDLMISVDMVGVGADLHVVDFEDVDAAFADELAAAAVAAGFDVDRMSRGEISDHVAFAKAGVPAAHIWRSPDPDYHTPGDDTVEDAAVLETLAVVEALIAHLLPEEHDLEGGANHHV